jgi:hypothetical protein
MRATAGHVSTLANPAPESVEISSDADATPLVRCAPRRREAAPINALLPSPGRRRPWRSSRDAWYGRDGVVTRRVGTALCTTTSLRRWATRCGPGIVAAALSAPARRRGRLDARDGTRRHARQRRAQAVRDAPVGSRRRVVGAGIGSKGACRGGPAPGFQGRGSEAATRVVALAVAEPLLQCMKLDGAGGAGALPPKREPRRRRSRSCGRLQLVPCGRLPRRGETVAWWAKRNSRPGGTNERSLHPRGRSTARQRSPRPRPAARFGVQAGAERPRWRIRRLGHRFDSLRLRHHAIDSQGQSPLGADERRHLVPLSCHRPSRYPVLLVHRRSRHPA